MEKYRWFGGIGYILLIVPYVNVASWALAGLGWLLLGRRFDQRLFRATGALMLVMSPLQAIGLIALLPLLATPPHTSTTMFGELSPAALIPILGVALIVVIIAIMLLVFEILSHFRAAALFRSRWFNIAGWLRILTIIVALVALPLTFIAVLKAMIAMGGIPEQLSVELAFSMFWPLIAAVSAGITSCITSAIAFIRLKTSK